MGEINNKLRNILIFARFSCAIIGFILAGAMAKEGQGWLLVVGTGVGFLVGHIVVTVVIRLITAKRGKENK